MPPRMARSPSAAPSRLKLFCQMVQRLDGRRNVKKSGAYATNADWVELVEPPWETYADQIFEFREQTKTADARQRIDVALNALGEIGRVLNRRLDQEIGIYANLKPKRKAKSRA